MTEIACVVCEGQQVGGVVITELHTLNCRKSHIGDLVVREGGGEVVTYLTLSEHIEKRAQTFVVRYG